MDVCEWCGEPDDGEMAQFTGPDGETAVGHPGCEPGGWKQS